jgi:hypothetical protein
MLCTHECTRLSTYVHSSHQYVYMRTYLRTYVRTYVRTHAYAYVRTRAQARACFTLEQICGRVHAVVKVRACASSRVHCTRRRACAFLSPPHLLLPLAIPQPSIPLLLSISPFLSLRPFPSFSPATNRNILRCSSSIAGVEATYVRTCVRSHVRTYAHAYARTCVRTYSWYRGSVRLALVCARTRASSHTRRKHNLQGDPLNHLRHLR